MTGGDMEWGVEKTQSDRSTKDNSVTANSPSIKILGVTDVRDETKDLKKATITPLPTISQSATRFTSRLSGQKTPVNRSRQLLNKDGNPITWAPKKRNPRLSRKVKAEPTSEYNERDKRRIADAEKRYTIQGKAFALVDFMEDMEDGADVKITLPLPPGKTIAAVCKDSQSKRNSKSKKSKSKKSKSKSRPRH